MINLAQLCHNFAMNLANLKNKNMNLNLPFDYLLINKFIFIINFARKGKRETLYLTFHGHSVTPPKSGKVAKLTGKNHDKILLSHFVPISWFLKLAKLNIGLRQSGKVRFSRGGPA